MWQEHLSRNLSKSLSNQPTDYLGHKPTSNFARPAGTFQPQSITIHHPLTTDQCFGTELHVCEQLAQSRVVRGWNHNPLTIESTVLTIAPPHVQRIQKKTKTKNKLVSAYAASAW